MVWHLHIGFKLRSLETSEVLSQIWPDLVKNFKPPEQPLLEVRRIFQWCQGMSLGILRRFREKNCNFFFRLWNSCCKFGRLLHIHHLIFCMKSKYEVPRYTERKVTNCPTGGNFIQVLDVIMFETLSCKLFKECRQDEWHLKIDTFNLFKSCVSLDINTTTLLCLMHFTTAHDSSLRRRSLHIFPRTRILREEDTFSEHERF